MIRSLGYVTVIAAGTPVRATVNQSDPTLRIATQSIVFQALPGNAGIVYIGNDANMDPSTGVGVLGFIPAPVSATDGPFGSWSASIPVAPAGLNAAEFYVDAVSSDDGVVVAITAG